MKRTKGNVAVSDFFSTVHNICWDSSSPYWEYQRGTYSVLPHVTGTSRYTNTSDQPKLGETDLLTDLVSKLGTPWDNTSGFPPFNVELHEKTGDVRFSFSLSGIDPDTVRIEFEDHKMWLIIDEQPESDSEWRMVKQKIKNSVKGRYYYTMDLERYDYKSAVADWKDGVLQIVIPVHKDRQPHRVKIKR